VSTQALPRGEPAAAAPQRAWRAVPTWTITAALALGYLILAPASSDLAAASYRSDLFARAGFTLWDNSWYGGHHLPAYSLLAPALGAWLGPQLLAALAMTVAAALFEPLAREGFPQRHARAASALFALGVGVQLLSNRVPFDLGVAFALAALLLARRARMTAALATTVVCSLASPVAGAFLALALLAWALGSARRGWPLALCAAALVPIALLAIAFPEGGSQPFVASAFYPTFLATAAFAALIPREQRVLRAGALLYAGVLLACYLLSTAVGGNADRLGALVAAPLALGLAGTFAGRRRLALLALLPFLVYWQLKTPISDYAAVRGDPSVASSYYVPLLGELHTLGVGYGARPARIEAVPTSNHWEARWLAPHVMIARGWERQLDRERNAPLYEPSTLTPAAYAAWLAREAVSYIALPDAELDYSGRAEARLVRRGSPYLREVWRSAHWRLFAVRGARPLAQAPAQMLAASTDSFALRAPRPGAYLVRVRFSPYWRLARGSGCVSSSPGGFTEIRARAAGTFEVVISFSLGRVLDRGPRCS
jgi:hypothetical protein